MRNIRLEMKNNEPYREETASIHQKLIEDVIRVSDKYGYDRDMVMKIMSNSISQLVAVSTLKSYQNKPFTNADKIRSMSDEELAKFIDDVGNSDCRFCSKGHNDTCEFKCVIGHEEWLQKEADADKAGENE